MYTNLKVNDSARMENVPPFYTKMQEKPAKVNCHKNINHSVHWMKELTGKRQLQMERETSLCSCSRIRSTSCGKGEENERERDR